MLILYLLLSCHQLPYLLWQLLYLLLSLSLLLIPISPSVQETSTVLVEDILVLLIFDTLVQPLMLSLVYSPTFSKFLASCLLLEFLSFVFVLGSLLSADTTVWPSLSLASYSHKQHCQPIAMCTASLPHKHRLYQKHSLTPSLVETSKPESKAIPSFLLPLFPKPISHPKHTVNHWCELKEIDHKTKVITNKSKKGTSEMSHNCALNK